MNNNNLPRWMLILGLVAGMVVGFFVGSIAENHAMHKTIVNIPDVDTIIECMVAEVPDNGPMIRSTIQFAAASDSLSAKYDPSISSIVEVNGQGFSNTEVQYDFWMKIQYDPIPGKWVVLNWRWDQVKTGG